MTAMMRLVPYSDSEDSDDDAIAEASTVRHSEHTEMKAHTNVGEDGTAIKREINEELEAAKLIKEEHDEAKPRAGWIKQEPDSDADDETMAKEELEDGTVVKGELQEDMEDRKMIKEEHEFGHDLRPQGEGTRFEDRRPAKSRAMKRAEGFLATARSNVSLAEGNQVVGTLENYRVDVERRFKRRTGWTDPEPRKKRRKARSAPNNFDN